MTTIKAMKEAGASDQEISLASYLHRELSSSWYRIIQIQPFYEDYHRFCSSKSYRACGQNTFQKALIEIFGDQAIRITSDCVMLPDIQLGRQRLISFIRRKSHPKNNSKRNKT